MVELKYVSVSLAECDQNGCQKCRTVADLGGKCDPDGCDAAVTFYNSTSQTCISK